MQSRAGSPSTACVSSAAPSRNLRAGQQRRACQADEDAQRADHGAITAHPRVMWIGRENGRIRFRRLDADNANDEDQRRQQAPEKRRGPGHTPQPGKPDSHDDKQTDDTRDLDQRPGQDAILATTPQASGQDIVAIHATTGSAHKMVEREAQPGTARGRPGNRQQPKRPERGAERENTRAQTVNG